MQQQLLLCDHGGKLPVHAGERIACLLQGVALCAELLQRTLRTAAAGADLVKLGDKRRALRGQLVPGLLQLPRAFLQLRAGRAELLFLLPQQLRGLVQLLSSLV